MKSPSGLSYGTYATEPPVDDGVVLPTILVLLFAGLFIALTTWGCPQGEHARHILEAEGYQEIKVKGGGHGWSCGNDGSATGFEATPVGGRRVAGVVCCGLVSKACTIRVERVLEPSKVTVSP